MPVNVKDFKVSFDNSQFFLWKKLNNLIPTFSPGSGSLESVEGFRRNKTI